MDGKEISKIRRGVKKARRNRSGVRARYPQSIKKLVLEVIHSGVSAPAISRATGLSTSTIFSWTQGVDKIPFRRVKVASKTSVNLNSEAELKVTLPNGVCIEGTTPAILKEILGWLE